MSWQMLGEVQIPLLAMTLLAAGTAKLWRMVRRRSLSDGLGPTVLLPGTLRGPAAIALCLADFGFGIGLILTSGMLTTQGPTRVIRLGTGLLFVVATCALLELRSSRPDIGCGCFGEFSTAPITSRTVVRSALLAVAAFATIFLQPLTRRDGLGAALVPLLAVELAVVLALSPEARDVLVRIGYSEPCELRVLRQEQTLAILQRSAQWRRYSGLIGDPRPTDAWRELCWRYISYQSQYADKEAQLVFAVSLQHRRPAVLAVLVDSATGAVLPWPSVQPGAARVNRLGRPRRGSHSAPHSWPSGPPVTPKLPELRGMPGMTRAR